MRTAFLVHALTIATLAACGGNESNYSGGSRVGQATGAQTSEVGTAANAEAANSLDATIPSVSGSPNTSGQVSTSPIKEPSELAQNIISASQLPANRKDALNSSVQGVLVAVQSKDQASIEVAQSQLVATAIGTSFGGIGGFSLAPAGAMAAGSADVAAILDAVKDLVAAAQNADLDGIRKAVEDIVAASM